jgi:hypothetical protein
VNYSPSPVPQQWDPRYMREELARIAASVSALAAGHLDKVSTMPSKPRDGDIRYLASIIAPGGVAGIYYFNGASWVSLG